MSLKCPLIIALLPLFILTGCKDAISPHVAPEADIETAMNTRAPGAAWGQKPSEGGKVILTLSNAPQADKPLEQDFITQLVETFEKRNPDIQVQYSPWQYTAESFFERAQNRTLTDVIEVDVAQMKQIIDSSAAADLTENVALSPEVRIMNPEVFRVSSADGRTYGVPSKLHTLGLFYNRRMLAEALAPKTAPADTSTSKGETKQSRGSSEKVTEYLLEEEPSKVIAQYGNQYGYPQQYPQQQQQQQRPQQQRTQQSRPQSQSNSRNRGRQEVQSYYNTQPQQYQQQYQQPGYGYQQPPQGYNPYQQPQGNQGRQASPSRQQGNQPMLYAPPDRDEDDARVRRMRGREEEPKTRSTDGDSTETTTDTANSDTLTTEAELAASQSTKKDDVETTVVKDTGLPIDWDQFIRLAVRLTDHDKNIAGYAPTLFSREGGREFSQWAIQTGLEVQYNTGETIALDINTTRAGDVAQFIKDLHWRLDVIPTPSQCYRANLLKMFAEKRVAMMMLPADGVSLSALTKLGMPVDDIGIAPLPSGIANGDHLTYGKVLIVNSQLDKQRRAAAFKWIMFMSSPEVQRLRLQFFNREGESTGEPQVPLYTQQMQTELYDATKTMRTWPLFMGYESAIANRLFPEPGYSTDRLYEAIAEGVRPIIERADSDPVQAMTLVGRDYVRRYLDRPDTNWIKDIQSIAGRYFVLN